MAILELPGKGIRPQPYSRIYSNTVDALNAFLPEDPTVLAYCDDTKLTYRWSGSTWEVI